MAAHWEKSSLPRSPRLAMFQRTVLIKLIFYLTVWGQSRLGSAFRVLHSLNVCTPYSSNAGSLVMT